MARKVDWWRKVRCYFGWCDWEFERIEDVMHRSCRHCDRVEYEDPGMWPGWWVQIEKPGDHDYRLRVMMGVTVILSLLILAVGMIWRIDNPKPTPTKPPVAKTAPVKKALTDSQMIRSLYQNMIDELAREKQREKTLFGDRLPAVRATGGKR